MLHRASGHETVQHLTLDAPEPMRALQTMLWLKMLSPTTFRRLPAAIMKPHERLQQIRCSLNKTPGEVAEQAGVSRAAYYDLESYTDEIFTSISLRDLQRICDCLGVDAFYLFTGANRSESDVCYDFETIAGLIWEHLKRSGQSAVEFSDRVGWEVEPLLKDTRAGWEWNVDCLRDVCRALGIRWELAL